MKCRGNRRAWQGRTADQPDFNRLVPENDMFVPVKRDFVTIKAEELQAINFACESELVSGLQRRETQSECRIFEGDLGNVRDAICSVFIIMARLGYLKVIGS